MPTFLHKFSERLYVDLPGKVMPSAYFILKSTSTSNPAFCPVLNTPNEKRFWLIDKGRVDHSRLGQESVDLIPKSYLLCMCRHNGKQKNYNDEFFHCSLNH